MKGKTCPKCNRRITKTIIWMGNKVLRMRCPRCGFKQDRRRFE